jgi:nucleotide-binding universal stress UspA family protein
MYQSILVPIDGSRHADKALAVAAQLAKASSSTRLHLLTVTEPRPSHTGLLLGGTAGSGAEAQSERLARGEQGDRLSQFDRALANADLSQVEVELHIEEGRPGEAIVEQARSLGVEAIVMGSRGVSDIPGMVFGSVSQRVSHTAGCTVILVL